MLQFFLIAFRYCVQTRWLDRTAYEENIVQACEQLLAKYMFFMPKPFRKTDPVTLARRDAPAGIRVFREAVIKFFRDGVQF